MRPNLLPAVFVFGWGHQFFLSRGDQLCISSSVVSNLIAIKHCVQCVHWEKNVAVKNRQSLPSAFEQTENGFGHREFRKLQWIPTHAPADSSGAWPWDSLHVLHNKTSTCYGGECWGKELLRIHSAEVSTNLRMSMRNALRSHCETGYSMSLG